MALLTGFLANGLRVVRWTIAGSALLIISIAGLAGAFETCSTKTSASSQEIQCGPPTLSDPTVLAIGLLIVLLVLPDLSEVGVLGVTLKRRIEAAEKRVDKESHRVTDLQSLSAIQQMRLESIALNQTISGASAQASLVVTPDVLRELQVGITEKGEAYLRREPIPDTALPTIEQSDEVAVRSAKVIRLWEEIRRATIDGAQVYPAQVSITEDQPLHTERPTRVERFVRVFADELQAVRTVRNAVAHAAPVSRVDLDRAIDVAARLLSILHESDSGDGREGHL